MPTKFLNLSTDTTLGGATPSDELAVSQKAIKTYVDNHSGGGGGSYTAGDGIDITNDVISVSNLDCGTMPPLEYTLTFNLTGNTSALAYLDVNGQRYLPASFTNNSLTLTFSDGTVVNWTLSNGTPGDVNGSLTLNSNQTVTINVPSTGGND